MRRRGLAIRSIEEKGWDGGIGGVGGERIEAIQDHEAAEIVEAAAA